MCDERRNKHETIRVITISEKYCLNANLKILSRHIADAIVMSATTPIKCYESTEIQLSG